MGSVTITIPTPVLTGGEVFFVKYKLKTASTWINVSPNPTNSPFTLTGLSNGEYEIEISLSEHLTCDAIQECFTVNGGCNCPTVSNQAFSTGSDQLNYISFDLDFSSSGFPACGLIIQIYDTTTGTTTTININSEADLILISSGHYTFKKQVTDTSYEISVFINCCNDNPTLCGQPFYIVENVPSPPTTCIPPLQVYFLSGSNTWKDPTSGDWFTIVYVKTTCDTLTINYSEIYTWLTPDSGSHVVTGVLALPIDGYGYREITIQVNPNSDDFGGQKYRGSVYDCCSNGITFGP